MKDENMMSPDLVGDEDMAHQYISLIDEADNEFICQILDTISYESSEILVLVPAEAEQDEEDLGLIFLELTGVDEDGEETFAEVEDEAVIDAVYAIFKDKWQDELEFID